MFTREDLETLTASQRPSRVRRIAGNYLTKVVVAVVVVEAVSLGFSRLEAKLDEN
jgi:hypothetical protein